MAGKVRSSNGYSIFGSVARGIAEVEDRAKSILAEKETSENMALFAKAISADWKSTENNIASLRTAFSDFEPTLEKRKPEITQFLNAERQKRMAQRLSKHLHDSKAF